MVYASLYLWGQGHTTAEGEKIPVRMDAMEFTYPAHLELLLPVVIEHTIDEKSPLFGHTHDSLTVRFQQARFSFRLIMSQDANCLYRPGYFL